MEQPDHSIRLDEGGPDWKEVLDPHRLNPHHLDGHLKRHLKHHLNEHLKGLSTCSSFKKSNESLLLCSSMGSWFLRQPPVSLEITIRSMIYRQHHPTVQFAKRHFAPQTPVNTGKPVLNSVTSFPAPGRKLFTVIVRPGAGKGASITLRINGWTRAGDISRLFSTSSKICKQIRLWFTACWLAQRNTSLCYVPFHSYTWGVQHRLTALLPPCPGALV